jgi:DNA repair exonuclease SbcCD ATPase subunit
MKRSLALLLLLAAFASACGESDQEKAQNQVCDARADIQKQVDELSSLTVGTATVEGVKGNLTAIRDDLKKIADAHGGLSDERKKEVETATKEFTSQLQSVASNAVTSQSLNDAKKQLESAFDQLAGAYKQSFAKIDCS